MTIELEAEWVGLSTNRWAVRPKGALGTCGNYPVPWDIQWIKARSAEEAIRKAKPL